MGLGTSVRLGTQTIKFALQRGGPRQEVAPTEVQKSRESEFPPTEEGFMVSFVNFRICL